MRRKYVYISLAFLAVAILKLLFGSNVLDAHTVTWIVASF